jgi:ABC-type lipoprotein export system ATPase subunit
MAAGPARRARRPDVGPENRVIRLEGVDKAVPTRPSPTFLLRRISLEVSPGDFVTVMGPSGAGKTTLLTILGMLDGDYTGEYWFGDTAVHALSARERGILARTAVGFVFQHYHLLDELTVAENLDLPLSYRNVPAADRAALVGDTLDRFQLVGKKDLFPRQLSGGQQQLVAVARAVIAGPRLLLADEPTGNLHSTQGREIMELFHRLNAGGVTIVQVTHSEENARYGNRVIHLKDGWLTTG